MFLLPRKGQDDGDSSSNSNCTFVQEYAASEHVAGSLTFQNLMTVISGACMALTALICLFLIIMHTINRRNVNEQKLVVRILLLPLSWSLFAFFGTRDYDAALFLDPIPLLMEAIAVAAMFELFITMLVPDRKDREAFFDGAELLGKKRRKIGNSSLQWYRLIYVRLYQLPVVFFVLTIASEALGATNCPENHVYKTVDIIVSVVSSVSTVVAVLALFRFVSRFKTELKPRGAFSKFAVLKGLVGLTTTQKLIIGILYHVDAIQASNKTSEYDLTVGLPDMLIEVEMLVAAIGFAFVYNWKPYTESNEAIRPQPGHYKKVSTIRFLLEGIYFPALFLGIWQALKYATEAVATRRGRRGNGEHSDAANWPAPQAAGYNASGEEYIRLAGSHSPRPSADHYELSPSRPQQSGYSDQTQGSTLQPSFAYGSQQYYQHAQQTAYSAPSMPPHAQSPQRMPQSMDPPTYTQRPVSPFNEDVENARRG